MKSIHMFILAGLLIPMAAMPMQQSGNTAKKSHNTKKNTQSKKKPESERSDKKKFTNRFTGHLNFFYVTCACSLLGEIYSYARPNSLIAKIGSENFFENLTQISALGIIASAIFCACDEALNAVNETLDTAESIRKIWSEDQESNESVTKK